MSENKQNDKKIEKVVSGPVKVRKKSGVRKFADVFISDDISNVKSYVVGDILVPSIKKAILGTVDMILNGGGTKYSNRSETPKVSYRKYYDDPRDEYGRRDEPWPKTRFDYDELVFETRGQAEVVLDQMRGAIERYGLVTIGDMYDMADVTKPYTSNNYGWTSLRNADVQRVRDGYILRLPKASPIDR